MSSSALRLRRVRGQDAKKLGWELEQAARLIFFLRQKGEGNTVMGLGGHCCCRVVVVVVWSLAFRSLEHYPGNGKDLVLSVLYWRVISVAADNVRRARLGRCKASEARGFTCLQHAFAAKLELAAAVQQFGVHTSDYWQDWPHWPAARIACAHLRQGTTQIACSRSGPASPAFPRRWRLSGPIACRYSFPVSLDTSGYFWAFVCALFTPPLLLSVVAAAVVGGV